MQAGNPFYVIVIRRLLYLIPVALAVSLLAFAIMHLAPGDPAKLMAGENASPEELRLVERRLGLDQPLYIQYFTFARNLVLLDLGTSFRTGQPVREEILTRLPATLHLGGTALVMSVLAGIPIGIIAATRPYSAWDNIVMTLAMVGVSVPIFVLGYLLILVFANYLGLFPTFGRSGMTSVILPGVALATNSAALLARMTRSVMLEVLSEDYVRTARAKGLSSGVVLVRHALATASMPLITLVGLQLALIVSGTVVTETVFSWPGIGRFLINSVHARDFPAIQGTVVFIAVFIVLANLIVDLTYLWLDPRVRL